MRKAGGLETGGSNPLSPTKKKEVTDVTSFFLFLDWKRGFEYRTAGRLLLVREVQPNPFRGYNGLA
jgi:hypothetical protein